ncbi:MAG: riboflavin biosynthesis protein RibF [Verrucomicrobia bacterium]|nr:MAG: riboflavin biosynthesis protein RibF [Verrucomicrobiota bacterium]
MSGPFQVFAGLEAIRLPDRTAHVAIGMFDGVHRGHRAVIESAVDAARHAGGLAGVFTFWPHPSRLFRPENPTRLIFSREQRLQLLRELGVDFVVEQPFDESFARIAAEDFVPRLKERIPGLATLYVGENWQFGRGRTGDVQALIRFANPMQIGVVSVARVHYNGEPISSTRIRGELAEGRVDVANALLGFPYFCEGPVIPGRQLGRRIGFPTLNVEWKPDLAPAFGVYAVTVSPAAGEEVDGLRAVANFGLRPTVDGDGAPLLEVHVLGECPYDVGDTVRVNWHTMLRRERRFDSIEALREQIGRDRAAALAFFERAPSPCRR